MTSFQRTTAVLLWLGFVTSGHAQGLPSDVEQQLGLRPGQALPSDLEQRGARPGAPLPSDVEEQLRARRASPALAEVWIVREGECGEWRSRWNVEQDQGGLWSGTIDYVHVGGPCVAPTGQAHQAEVRAAIAGDHLFALRSTEDGRICSYVAQVGQSNRGRGVVFCEANETRGRFAIRFRAPQDRQPMQQVPPDDDLLAEEQPQQPQRRFNPRGSIEHLFRR